MKQFIGEKSMNWKPVTSSPIWDKEILWSSLVCLFPEDRKPHFYRASQYGCMETAHGPTDNPWVKWGVAKQ